MVARAYTGDTCKCRYINFEVLVCTHPLCIPLRYPPSWVHCTPKPQPLTVLHQYTHIHKLWVLWYVTVHKLLFWT